MSEYSELRFQIPNFRFQTPDSRFQISNLRSQIHVADCELATGATAGLPFGRSARRICRRCFFRLKSRERQLIRDSKPAVISRFTMPNAIAIAFPAGARFRPPAIESIVRMP